nr:helix-turn-helix domain-containing protein [bacterium]
MIEPQKKGALAMNMADRIQYLRKVKGISQEELADQIGVSRQAVSKWESEQSVPDIDKIISMSEYFEVATDYILKGEHPALAANRKPAYALCFGLAIIFALLAAIVVVCTAMFTAFGCFFIILLAGVIGLCIGLVFQAIVSLLRK